MTVLDFEKPAVELEKRVEGLRLIAQDALEFGLIHEVTPSLQGVPTGISRGRWRP
jgi:hypothetical protein